MVDFRAFRGWRPPAELAEEVAAVPYDVVSTAEARVEVEGRPRSLLRVTRPDVDLPDGTSLYGEQAYGQAKLAFKALLDAKALVEEAVPAYYAYALTMDGHTQIGLVGLASAADYWADKIKKHEHTRPTKEDDRMRHIEAVRAHLGPVFMAYRKHKDIDLIVAKVVESKPEVDFTGLDNVRHRLWPITDHNHESALVLHFGQVSALYIADGHHRAAAASRIGKDAPLGDRRGHFLAVVFPDDQLRIMAYNRVVVDLNGLTPEAFQVAVEKRFEVTPIDGPKAPEKRGSFAMYLGGQWSKLTPKLAIDTTNPTTGLDVSVLQDRLLAPILGIDDPRTSERIDFVGGIRGLEELAKRAGEKGVAFALYPTSMGELLSIADAGQVMPPKSTWFEPKLRSGMVVSRF